ncbi:histidine kinase 1 isoform X2 [Olea europaea subsp. europaea]|uniref:histidine kinase n=1 Tax=Olea europaea subsp. europaea TaxID=158383 RepID=A0A8S0PGA6_OLEEU|nr:histidine kinase 1 isoform X2 [Olea europaea subsp. europaea]
MASESAPYPSLPRVFSRISDFFDFRQRNNSVSNQRSTQDVERDEIQYPSPLCLSSSYYSVFVVRLAIMVMLAILIGLLTLLTWHFTRVYTARSLNTLAYELRHELLQRPILRMWNILNTTVEVATSQVKLSEYVIRRYSKPDNQAQQVELYEAMRDVTWALFASRRALNSITISYKNGFVQAFHRNHKSNNTYYIYSDLANYSISGVYGVNMISSHQGWNDQSIHNNMSAIWYQQPLDPMSGEKIGKPKKIPPDELINIAGISQVPDGTPSWHVAVSKYTDSPLLSAALPVWDPSHENIVAVVGVTTALYSVGQLMKELVEVHSGHIYLTSQEGWLLATSTNTPLLMNSTKGPNLMMAADSEDNVIRSGAECLQKTYSSKFPSSQEIHIENARLGNQLYYIDSFFLNLKRLPMVGVIIIPRKYIMGKVDEKAFKTLLILISASLCIIVVGCICVFILTNGVSKEMKLRAELISHLDARRKAEASSNYKSQFLANMSHELRTPMAAVIGLLDILLSDDCLTNEQYAMITQIRKCSNALLRLLNNILDLSKVESGKLVLEETEFDLGRELEGLIDMFSVQCINHNVETVLDISDDMPKVVRGDSGRIVQIFVNLINNSIKFTTSGYIILRAWCENLDTDSNERNLSTNQMDSSWVQKMKLKRQGWHGKRSSKKDNKIILWFEVDDTGCGIDPSKWESVFESFEQADPSTTRHGGTGLGLCIVRTLVDKMNGEIKVVKKSGTGTLMQLYLILSTPAESTKQQYLSNLEEQNLTVLLALNGRMTRMIMSQWLQKNGVYTYEASDWNGLTQNLQELFNVQSLNSVSKPEESDLESNIASVLIIIIDIGLLDLSTDVWKQQLNVLQKYFGRVKFAWILNHDISSTIKTQLRSSGHLLMVNRPLYKAKMIQILEAVIRDRNFQMQNNFNGLPTTVAERQLYECLEIDAIHSTSVSSDDSDKSEKVSSNTMSALRGAEKNNEHFSDALSLQRVIRSNGSSSDLTRANLEEDASDMDGLGQRRSKEQNRTRSCPEDKGSACSYKVVNERKSLEGLRILLAEDTPVLQRVATIMLEKMGAEVVVVGDGIQAVDALQYITILNEYKEKSLLVDGNLRTTHTEALPYDLVLMDCQMPKMDGYEATRAIRKSESGTGLHIPIVALTAHAMSCDEAKCLEVGMDAYLTKPIDCKRMVSTILSLTKRIV